MILNFGYENSVRNPFFGPLFILLRRKNDLKNILTLSLYVISNGQPAKKTEKTGPRLIRGQGLFDLSPFQDAQNPGIRGEKLARRTQ